MSLTRTHPCTARSSAKRKRLQANQDDAPPPRKIQKTVAKRESTTTTQLTTVSVAQSKESEKPKSSVKTLLDPVDTIGPEDIGLNGNKPPLRYYGCPFKYEQVLEYAKRHHLCFRVDKRFRHLFGGKEQMDFADLTEEHHSHRLLIKSIPRLAALVVSVRLSQRAGFRIDIGYPLSKEFDGMMYVWDNYNLEERFDLADLMDTWDDGVKILEDAMTEITGRRSKLQWWHSWKNWRLKG